MDPYARFTRCIFEWCSPILQFVGHDFIVENFQPSLITHSIYALANTTFVAEAHTFVCYDTLSRIFALLWFFMGFQATMKLLNSRYAEHFRWTICLIQDLYRIHSKTKSANLAEFFEKFSLFTEILFKFIMFGYCSCPVAFMLYPVYMYFVRDELMPIIPGINLPGIDQTTVIGFVFHNLYLFFIGILGCVCLSALEFLLAIIITSSLIFAKLISRELKQMNTDLQDEDCDVLTVIGRFRNIFLMHQKMGEYMVRVDILTFRTFFVQIGTAFVGAIVCFYPIFIMYYLPTIGTLLMLLFQIFIACLLGNCVQMTHDQIYESALLLDWNQLQIREQLYYKFFLRRCQTPTPLPTIGGFIPLNLNSCVKIFARIYTITMLIYTMLF